MQELPASLLGAIDLPVRRVASVSFHDTSSPMNSDAILRKGKWTTEEEDYANKIISLFNRGLLSIPAGTTLRSYLSDKLHCDPMRITKKFAGASCIGKQVFQPSGALLSDRSDEIEELEGLETLFFHRVGDRSGSAYRISPEEETENPIMQKKAIGVKWNREEGDTDISSAKHRANFNKINIKTTNRPVATLGPGIGMRSVVSAPDFGELKLMHENVERIVKSGLKREFAGTFNRKQRSQSVTDFMDFEHYISDDSAAGDLLMQFASKINDTRSDEDNENENEDDSEEAAAETTGPVTKFVSSSTIGNNNKKNRINSPIKSKKVFDNDDNIDGNDNNENENDNDNENYHDDDSDNNQKDNEKDNPMYFHEDDGAIHIDQSNALSCSTPQSHSGCNYEDDEDNFDCYEISENRTDISIPPKEKIEKKSNEIVNGEKIARLTSENRKAEDTTVENKCGNIPIPHNNVHNEKKNVEIKSEFKVIITDEKNEKTAIIDDTLKQCLPVIPVSIPTPTSTSTSTSTPALVPPIEPRSSDFINQNPDLITIPSVSKT